MKLTPQQTAEATVEFNETEAAWFVVATGFSCGPFATQSKAWDYIDRNGTREVWDRALKL